MSNMNSQLTEVLTGIRSEITVDVEGKGSITRNGLAKLLGIRADNLIVERTAVKLAESLAALGFGVVEREFKNGIPDIAVACIIKYYALYAQRTTDNAKILLDSFSAIGIRTWFQDVTGYQKPRHESKLETMELALKAMTDMCSIMRYTSNKPGLQNILDSAVESNGVCLPGYLTVRGELQRLKIQASQAQMRDIGRKVAEAYKNSTGMAPGKVLVSTANEGSKCKSYLVACYPVDSAPIIENAVKYVLSSQEKSMIDCITAHNYRSSTGKVYSNIPVAGNSK
jgi:hypothetical protein